MYCSRENLEADIGLQRLTQLTDFAVPPAGAVDEAVLSPAILAATGEIDSYTAARYGAPLPIVTDLIRDIAIALTIDRLYKYAKPEEVSKRAAAARALLANIARGTASIPELETAAPASAGDALFDAAEPVFSRDLLRDY